MSTLFGANIATLLHAAGVHTADDHTDLAAAMSVHSVTSASAVARWAAGDPIHYGPQVRALLTVLPVSRRLVFDHIAPAVLLPALWCPALGDQLTARREAAGMTRENLAAASGVSVGSLNRWEQAQTLPRAAALHAVCAALDVTAADLLGYGDWPPAETPAGARTVFSLWLARTLQQLSMSESQLARELGLSQCSLNGWARGRTFPDRSTWDSLAAAVSSLGAPVTGDQLRQMQPAERVSPRDLDRLTPLARLLTESRMALALSHDVTADRVGVAVSVWRSWERGRTKPATRLLPAVRQVLDIDADTMAEVLRTQAGETRRDIGASMRFRHKVLGLDGRDVARRLGVHRNLVHRWEAGYLAVSNVFYDDLADILEVSTGTLYDWASEPDPVRVAFGKALRAAREERNLTQYQVADHAGLTQRQVSGMEAGSVPATAAVRELLGV